MDGVWPAEELLISLRETGLPSDSLWCLFAEALCWGVGEGLGGRLTWILGIMDLGLFLGRWEGLADGLVLDEQSDGTEPVDTTETL